MQNSTYTQLDRRSARIFNAIQVGTVRPGSDAFVELAELSNVLEVAPVKPVVVARMTVTRAVGNLTIIEVFEDATFSNFYRIYTQVGKRRSTKRLVRVANRNECVQPYYRAHLVQPGLAGIADHWRKQPGVESVKVRIIKARTYRKLINARPDELGLVKSRLNIQMRRFSPQRGLLVQIKTTEAVQS